MTDLSPMVPCWCTHYELDHAIGVGCLKADCECTKYQPADVPAPRPNLLTPQQIRMVGAMTGEEERSQRNLDFIESQKGKYQDHSKESLIEELARRDAALLQEGKDLADGKMAGRFLREFARVMISSADHADIRTLDRQGRELTGGKGALVENILRTLGAEPLDNRRLRLEGSGLGVGDTTPAEAEERISAPDRIPQLTSLAAADSIRASRADHVVAPVNSPLNTEGANRSQETDDGQTDQDDQETPR